MELLSCGAGRAQMSKLLKGGPGKFKENGQQMLMQKMMEQVRRGPPHCASAAVGPAAVPPSRGMTRHVALLPFERGCHGTALGSSAALPLSQCRVTLGPFASSASDAS